MVRAARLDRRAGLVKRFGTVEALAGCPSRSGRGELYGLVGPDGAGKTTAIRALAGLIGLDGGEARVLGQDPRPAARCASALGLMPQQYSLYRDLTVAENLRFFARLYVLPARGLPGAAPSGCSPSPGSTASPTVAPTPLSGGMYKKLALACALLHEPRGAAPRRAHQRRGPGLAARAVGAPARVRAGRHGGARLHALHGRGRALRPRGAGPPRPAAAGGRAGGAHRRASTTRPTRSRGATASALDALLAAPPAGASRLAGRGPAPGGAWRGARGTRWPPAWRRSAPRSRPAAPDFEDLFLVPHPGGGVTARPRAGLRAGHRGARALAPLRRLPGGGRRQLRGRAGRDLRLPGRQRRRQVHHHPHAHRAARAERRHGARWPGTTSAATPTR